MLEITELLKAYGQVTALSIDSFSVSEHSIVVLVGNNGAGKTTLLRLLANLVRPSAGQIRFYVEAGLMEVDGQALVAAYLDETFLLDFLTVREYFNLILSINRLHLDSLHQRLEEFSDFLLPASINSQTRIHQLSSGNKQKVGVVAAFLSQKKIILLDEPFAGLDTKARHFLECYFKKIKMRKRQTIILSSHQLENLEDFSSRLVVIRNGTILSDEAISTETLSNARQILREASDKT